MKYFATILVLVALCSCGGGGGGDGADEQPSTQVLGSRENPVPLGQESAFVDGIGVSVVGAIPNANDIVAEENQFNDPPKPGFQFFLARVKIHNVGTTFMEYDPNIDLEAIGDNGVAYLDFRDRCGVIPDRCDSDIQLAAGGSVECNICWQVGSNEAASMLMFRDSAGFLEETGEPFFFDLVP